MAIYGVTILSFCMFCGMYIGMGLGKVIGVKANVGGVGFAMLILVLLVDYLLKKGKLSDAAQKGIQFWSAMYIPIIVAMSARQNVVAALKGGPTAIVAGVVAVAAAFLLVPSISKLAKKSDITKIEQ
ncbi:MAG TPA: malonate transporter subunit MadL [Spirochaetota bacterium]|nr:malonate transporter subunit MadL [Spirochaetota bacterium]HPJ34226.1 malonate transporter subunit MadL [Spirochaetota bacterium]